MKHPVELWNWGDSNGKPALLTRFLYLCWQIDWQLHATPFNSDMSNLVKEYSRDFTPGFSENVVIGLSQAWLHLSKLTVAEKSYEELSDGSKTEGAEERFIPMAPALRWFWHGIENDLRAVEAKKWLLSIGWGSILQQAEKRDAAIKLVLAGHAVSYGCYIEEKPAYTRARKKADRDWEEAMQQWVRAGGTGPQPDIADYLAKAAA
ncbi:hypothetical protein [Acetobacter persici]|uniref:hypothetical protein n=1 Tax=Acetobacter persici TaxID=1076596 RepID=UPI001F175EBE|nr:hypothetical protein [Acetobacter persici]MCG0998231.1 hypothetical protein [Acetobacter persici]